MHAMSDRWAIPKLPPISLATGLLLIGIGALYLPTLYDLFRGVWSSDEQGHGPIILALSVWLIYKRWPSGALLTPRTDFPVLAGLGIVVGIAMYVLGRSQSLLLLEVGSALVVVASAVLLMRGTGGLRPIVFGFFFLCFLIPLPNAVVDMVTQPMKLAVSTVAEWLLMTTGYPVARTGVILQVGQYQLLVADACAGLHTLLTLEALGLLYLNLVESTSTVRNVALAILVVPISFTANVIRVVVLCLITYHFGDEAGQGFLHGFAGMVLFMAALFMILATDLLLRRLFASEPVKVAA
jgi:exosortase B